MLKEDDDSDNEKMSLMVWKFTNFKKAKGNFKISKKENQRSSLNFKCYKCGELGHVKVDCPNSNKNEEKKGSKFKIYKKVKMTLLSVHLIRVIYLILIYLKNYLKIQRRTKVGKNQCSRKIKVCS